MRDDLRHPGRQPTGRTRHPRRSNPHVHTSRCSRVRRHPGSLRQDALATALSVPLSVDRGTERGSKVGMSGPQVCSEHKSDTSAKKAAAAVPRDLIGPVAIARRLVHGVVTKALRRDMGLTIVSAAGHRSLVTPVGPSTLLKDLELPQEAWMKARRAARSCQAQYACYRSFVHGRRWRSNSRHRVRSQASRATQSWHPQ